MVAAGRTDGGLVLPQGVARLRRIGAGRYARYCLVRVLSSDATTIEADLDIVDADGEVVLQAAGLRMGTKESKGSERDRVLAQRLLTVEWDRHDPPTEITDAGAGTWLLIASDGRGEFTEDLSEAMINLGAQCRTLYTA